jgi:electron transfer flavoprotein alpha subunit
MKYTVVMNGCTGSPCAQALELNGFLRQPAFRGGAGTTVLFHDGAFAALLPLVATEAVILVQVTRYQPEQVLDILEELAPRLADLYLFFDDPSGRELSVRLGHRLGGTALTGVRALSPAAQGLRCTKAVYGSHVEAAFLLRRKPCCLALAKGCADPLPVTGTPRILMTLDRRAEPPAWVEQAETTPGPAPAGLEDATFILAIGMGAQTPDRAARLAALADALGAELGASRPVVMNAWVPMHRLVGVSGAMTRPALCIVAGASGSAAFMAGIQKSRFILALNTDDQAPILKCCDAGAVGDCLAILEELVQLFKHGGA